MAGKVLNIKVCRNYKHCKNNPYRITHYWEKATIILGESVL